MTLITKMKEHYMSKIKFPRRILYYLVPMVVFASTAYVWVHSVENPWDVIIPAGILAFSAFVLAITCLIRCRGDFAAYLKLRHDKFYK